MSLNIQMPSIMFGYPTNSSQPNKKLPIKKNSSDLYDELLDKVPNNLLNKLPNELWYNILEITNTQLILDEIKFNKISNEITKEIKIKFIRSKKTYKDHKEYMKEYNNIVKYNKEHNKEYSILYKIFKK